MISDVAGAGGVTWIGHATVLLEIGGVRLLTDPVLRGRVGPLLRVGPRPDPSLWHGVDAVLISHLHHDHLDLPSLRRLPPSVPVVVPVGAAKLLAHRGDVRELAVGQTLTIGGVTISAVHAHHDGRRVGARVHAAALGYLIDRVWFAGDTGLHAGIAELAGRVDTALVPVGGWGLTLGEHHLDPRQAAEAIATIGPGVAVPIHWGTLFMAGAWHLRHSRSRDAGRLFAEAAAELAPATRVALARPGERIPLPERP